MIDVATVQKRLVAIRRRHQDLRRRRDGQDLQIAEVLAHFAGGHDPGRRRVPAPSARSPPDEDLLTVVADEARPTDVLVLLVTVHDVLKEGRVNVGDVLELSLRRVKVQWRNRCYLEM